MGKISEYQRSRLASEYVGAAQRDNSAALTTGAMTSAIEPVRQKEVAKLKAREELLSDQRVNNGLIKYNLEVQTMAKELQIKHSANPDAYPEALQAGIDGLAEQYLTKISNKKDRAGLQAAITATKQQMVKPAVEWSYNKQEDNANKAVDDTIETTVLTAESYTSPGELLMGVAALSQSVYDVTTDESGFSMLTTEQKDTKFEDASERIVDVSLTSQAHNSPEQLIKYLKENRYDDLKFNIEGRKGRVPFTGEMKNKYRKMAELRIKAIEREKKDARDKTYQEVNMGIVDGTVTYADIEALRTSDDEYRKLDDRQARITTKSWMAHTKYEMEDIIQNSDKIYEFSQFIEEYVDNKLDKSRIYEKAIEAWGDRIIDDEETKYLTAIKDTVHSPEVNNSLSSFLNFTKVMRIGSTDMVTGVKGLIKNLREGMAPNKALDKATRRAQLDKVLRDDPSLSGFDDPVQEAYMKSARQQMEAAGYPTGNEKDVRAVAESIRNKQSLRK